jgi:diaminobutyrate acetyltransferase
MSATAAPDAVTTTALRLPRPDEGPVLHDLVVAGGGLDVNSPYAYVLGVRFFASTSVIAEGPDGATGFVLGLTPPQDPGTLFVWQVGVAPQARGQGLGLRMLQWLVDEVRPRQLEATVTPSNVASQRLFRALARAYDAPLEVARWAASTELDGAEPEDLHRIGPFPS